MKRYIFIILLTVCSMVGTQAQKITRVEPLNWWVGMNTPLQIMFYGESLKGYDVKCLTRGVTVTGVHTADSPNYLFVDVEIAPQAKAGEYIFEFRSGRHTIKQSYTLAERRADSANRESYSAGDMIYLLMPDRFANGDTSNDNVDECPDKIDREHHNGRHGGDIQGIIDHLDYIASIGATAIWSTPLTLDNEPEVSYHGYAAADYYRIDPRFGDNELYRTMVRKAHENGLKVIMDLVPNHCGAAHWWMGDLPFKDWINHPDTRSITNHAFGSFPDPNAAEVDRQLCHTGWFVESMPDMNLTNPFVLQYFKQLAVWWIEYADLDGLRIDTFPYPEREATAQWVSSILKEYPRLRIVGECWVNSPAMVAYWDGATKNNDGYSSSLPSVMDFPLQEAIIEALKPDTINWGEGLTKVYNVLAHDFLYSDPRSLMIFASNHDTDRMAYFMKSNPQKMNLAMTMIATLRGIPQLYVGSEQMFLGEQPLGHGGQRIDFPGGWTEDERNLFTGTGRTVEEEQVLQHVKRIFNWRKTATAIHQGRTLHFAPRDNCYVYFRYTDDKRVMVVVNASQNEISIDWERFAQGVESCTTGYDVVSDTKFKIGENTIIQPLTSMIIELN